MKRFLPISFLLLLLTLGTYYVLTNKPTKAQAATASHLVISEIQIATASGTNGDFIELYNPTSSDINVGNFNLVKRTSGSGTDTSIVNFNVSDVIKAHGYFLWCNTGIAIPLSCDKHSSDTITNNNSIGIRNGPANTGAIVDAVTIGVTLHTLGEGNPPATPSANQSIERKANSSSNSTTMGSGGIDEFLGNGEDTDNNSTDFVIRTTAQPQNSQSEVEPPLATPTDTPTPTLSPTLTISPTESPTPTTTPIPTLTPTVTPSPTLTPIPTESPTPIPTSSPTPTETPVPTSSPTPSEIPTVSPSPTPTISATPTPTVTLTPTPTPQPSKILFQFNNLTCTLSYKSLHIFNFQIFIPQIKCSKI